MTARLVEVRLPKFPECWETCGDCNQGEVVVLEVHVKPGDVIRHDDNLITLETGKVALDIPRHMPAASSKSASAKATRSAKAH